MLAASVARRGGICVGHDRQAVGRDLEDVLMGMQAEHGAAQEIGGARPPRSPTAQ